MPDQTSGGPVTITQPDAAAIAALLDTDPAAGLAAAADLREQRTRAATGGPYGTRTYDDGTEVCHEVHAGPDHLAWLYIGAADQDRTDAEHIAAEANPAHTLAEAALWRSIARRHTGYADELRPTPTCTTCGFTTPCPDLRAAVAAARAYLGGTQ